MLRSKPLPLDPVAAEGNAEHVDSLAQRLQLVERQIGEIETKLERHIAEFSEVPHPEDTDAALEDPQRPNDTQILRSMPGIGMTVASVLLSEAQDVLARRDYESLRCLSGVAPVTRQSGKSRVVRRRRAADRRLSDALYHWARIAIQRDSVSRAKYTACRARGHSHGRALRTVADRLLYVVLYHVAQRHALSATARPATVRVSTMTNDFNDRLPAAQRTDLLDSPKCAVLTMTTALNKFDKW